MENRIMETEPEPVGKILRDAFDAALLERDNASTAFDEILRDTPSGLLHPDGPWRIKSASKALSVAREKMIAAMVRLRDYESLGIIPEDLKRKPAQKESAAPQIRSGSG